MDADEGGVWRETTASDGTITSTARNGLASFMQWTFRQKGPPNSVSHSARPDLSHPAPSSCTFEFTQKAQEGPKESDGIPRRKFTVINSCFEQVRLGATGGYVKALDDFTVESCPEGSVLDEAVRCIYIYREREVHGE